MSSRRDFLKTALALTSAGAAAGAAKANAAPASAPTAAKDKDAPSAHVGCLVDTTLCVGCRKCEEACNKRNKLAQPKKPFSDREVLRDARRPSINAFTVINAHHGAPSQVQQDHDETFVKLQCMHCLDPACVSACIVGALTKNASGSVDYDAQRCIGCRYCMVACPFEIPSYEYDDPLTPRVRKCTYCADGSEHGPDPACAAACPMEAIVFGPRSDLLALARKRVAQQPDRYHPEVYGAKEVGGTSWLYLVGRTPKEIGLLPLPETAPPRLTEAIQHGIFRYGAAPVAVYGSLAAIMWFTNRKNKNASDADPHAEEEGGSHE
ncbi:MAG: 4Fe-4S dicluster domain-containing protein [Deltaproteobacteria bacterium]|nr:4Fe-4S dicluster domain-containing protein [Deltaproteobacteria bacterium]